MKILRRKTKQIRVGNVLIGGDAPVSVQSMTTTETWRIDETVAQIAALEQAGCEIVRVAVPDTPSAEALPEIRRQTALPLIADIHFDYKLALKALEAGVDCLRINPGNIGDRDKVERVVKAAKERRTPMRIGVNAGSLERELLEKHGYPTAEAMVESALSHIRILEDLDFFDIKVSLKASNVGLAVAAYRAFSRVSDYPLHLGIRGRHGVLGRHQISRGAGYPPGRGDRRHDSRVVGGRSGRRGQNGVRDSQSARAAPARRERGRVPDLRAIGDRRDPDGQ